MVFDRHGNELPTECVLAKYHYQSSWALYLEFTNGLFRWIPKSMIGNLEEFDHSNFSEFRPFEIAEFLTKIHGLPIEY
jgi:hypothetical protein